MSRESVVHATGTKQQIASVIDVLIEEWRHARASVAVLDHNATDSLQGDVALADVEARELVTTVLANNPHPRRIAVRSAKDWSDQPRPVAEPPARARSAAARTATATATAAGGPDEPGGGGPSPDVPELMLITGGFRWEYGDAIDELDTHFGPNLKLRYDAMLQQIVPAGVDVDEHVPTGPIGGSTARLAAGAGLEPLPRPSTEADIRGIEQQIEVWTQISATIDEPFAGEAWTSADTPEEMHTFADDMIDRLEGHELRQRPLRWLDVPGLDGVLGRDDLQLLLTSFSSGERLWQRATVQDAEPPAGITSAAYLANLSDRAWTEPSRPGPIGFDPDPIDLDDELPGGTFPWDLLPPEFIAAAPLLFQLVESTLAQSGDRQELSEALVRLAAVDPVELDWMLRETLGLGTHRLDAWHTSLATERLSAMRSKSPTGVYVGSYGFVLDLDRSLDRPSHGFIHAPSLPHAASAAVLRSGWMSRGNNDNESPAAIDLASGRVRQADWILAGVRHGQDLGDLLGAEFERSLHDARLDVAIRPLRAAVAAADGLGDSALDVPVDGVRLLDLHRAGELDATIGDLALEAAKEDRLVDLIGSLESTFDAIDDVTTFESVHQLVVGNLDRAAAVVDGMGPNGGRPPELTGVRTPRDALTIDTRALVLIDASARSRGWAVGTRDRFDPELDGWAAAVLPPPADVGWLATTPKGDTVELRLDDLAVSALDACVLASDDPASITPALRRLAELAYPQHSLVEHRPSNGGAAPITLAEFQLVAVELKRVIQESTPADDSSVAVPGGDETAHPDASDTIARATDVLDAVLGTFDAVSVAVDWAGLTVEQQADLARLGLVPSPVADPAADFASVRSRLARRRKAADGVEAVDTIAGMRARVAQFTGVAVPLVVPFNLPASGGGVELSGTLATVDEIDDWFDVVASVHPNVATLWRALQLGGLITEAAPTLAAGQAPLLTGRLVGRPAPAGAGHRGTSRRRRRHPRKRRPGSGGRRPRDRSVVGADPRSRPGHRRGLPLRRSEHGGAPDDAPRRHARGSTVERRSRARHRARDDRVDAAPRRGDRRPRRLRACPPDVLRARPVGERGSGGGGAVIGPWDRIEGSSRDDELDAGVEARVADPLWMLARQWQVGEFRGDDAGNPIAARMEWQAMALRSYRPGDDGSFVPMPTTQPLERVVEAAPPPTGGGAGLHWSSRLAAQLSRRLARDGHGDAVVALAQYEAFELPTGDAVALPGAGSTATELLRRRSFDGAAVVVADDATIGAALAGLPATTRDEALGIIERWQAATKARFTTPPRDTWDDTRLEHRFSITAGTGDSEVVITAAEYTGGHLDWYSFDVEPRRRDPVGTPPIVGTPPVVGKPPVVERPAEQVTAIPTPVRYAGMPASRWWAFEQGDVHFGDIAAAPGDLGRLLLADYVTVYGNDWYSIPLRLPLGTVSQVLDLRVYDTMGGSTPIAPAALADDRRPAQRAFRLYELSGDPSVKAGKAPLLLLPPSLSGADVGPMLERVELVRDEAANLVWGIERFVEGPTGRAVDRLQHWRMTTPPAPATAQQRVVETLADDDLETTPKEGPGRPPPVKEAPGRPLPPVSLPPVSLPPDRPQPTDDDTYTPTPEAWRYRLESTAPPFWIPFVPRRIGTGAQFRLRRARMQEWELLDRSVTGVKGELLQPRQPMVIEEEEVPRGGVTLERRWQSARWTDGSLHVWLQRTKRLGYGERSSGLRWDSLEDLPEADGRP